MNAGTSGLIYLAAALPLLALALLLKQGKEQGEERKRQGEPYAQPRDAGQREAHREQHPQERKPAHPTPVAQLYPQDPGAQAQRTQDDQPHPSPHHAPATGEGAFSHWLGALPLYRDRGNVWREARRRSRRIAGLALTLRRAGVANPRDQLALCASAAIGAALAALVAGGCALHAGHAAGRAAAAALAVFAGLIIATLAFTRRRAAHRQRAIEEEASMVIQVTRMLWRVGLSLPRTIAVLCEELPELAPATTRELRSLLHKIDAGQSQEEALAELAEITTAEGFREYLVIIRQVSQSGGGVDQALADLYQLLQNRRRTALQEKVSKLSAKMSVVMMLFLFPTLLIVVGGPGFIAIAGAMARLAGG